MNEKIKSLKNKQRLRMLKSSTNRLKEHLKYELESKENEHRMKLWDP